MAQIAVDLRDSRTHWAYKGPTRPLCHRETITEGWLQAKHQGWVRLDQGGLTMGP